MNEDMNIKPREKEERPISVDTGEETEIQNNWAHFQPTESFQPVLPDAQPEPQPVSNADGQKEYEENLGLFSPMLGVREQKKPVDLLKELYPALASDIDSGRQNGMSDEDIFMSLEDTCIEMMAEKGYTPEQLDTLLGRTPERKQRAQEEMLDNKLTTLGKLTGLHRDEVADRIESAGYLGYAPSTFLLNEELWKARKPAVEPWKHWWEALWMTYDAKQKHARFSEGSGVSSIASALSGKMGKKDIDEFLKAYDELQEQTHRKRSASVWQTMAAATGDIGGLIARHIVKAYEWSPVFAAAAVGYAFTKTGSLGLTPYGTATGLGGATLAAAKAGGGAVLDAMNTTAVAALSGKAANYLTTMPMEALDIFADSLRKGANPRIAALYALGGGFINARIEEELLKSAANALGRLAPKGMKAAFKENIISRAAGKFVRQGLKDLPVPARLVLTQAFNLLPNTAMESLEEPAQGTVSKIATTGALVQSGKKTLREGVSDIFSKETWNQAAEEFTGAGKEFFAAGIVPTVANMVLSLFGYRAFKKSPQGKALARYEAIRKSNEKYDAKEDAKNVFISREALQTFKQSLLEKQKTTTEEATKEQASDTEETTAAAKQETIVEASTAREQPAGVEETAAADQQISPEETATESGVEKQSGVEEAAGTKAPTEGPSIEEQLGITDADLVESTGEYRIDREKFDAVAKANPVFADAVADHVRIGSYGLTAAEAAEKINGVVSDPLNADNEYAQSARKVYEEARASLKEIGKSDEEAEATARMYAKYLLARSIAHSNRLTTTGLPMRKKVLAEDLHKLEIRKFDARQNKIAHKNAVAAQEIANSNSGVFNQELLTKDDYDEKGNIRPEVVQEIKDELSTIRTTAQNNGTYLMADNGQKSNLPAGVWEMVHTRRFKEWFGESKAVDENGEPLVMYHGTPDGSFVAFHPGAYFSSEKQYADRYQNPSASSISTSKQVVNPKTFAVFLNIKKPFDLNDPEARRIYIEEYVKGGNAIGINPYLSDEEYAKITDIDWTEGEDLKEFLQENGYDYDGIRLNEGGDPDGKGGVIYRGDSYLVFNPNQIKSINNRGTFDAGENIFYQQQAERRYKGKLHQDSIAWAKAVDKYLIGEMGNHDIVRVMDMPLALELAGAPVREIVADKTFFDHTISGKHSGEVKPALMKKLVRSLADPIMVFDSASHPGTSLVAMLELQDEQGATIVVPVRLQMNPNDPNTPAKIASFYGKGDPKTGVPNDKWFIKQVVDKKGNLTGRLKYVNTKKLSRWSSAGGLQLPRVLAPSRLPSSISTEVDLVKYRKMNGNLFYQSAAPSNTLVATHGIDVSALEKALANFDGRLPMPSLAIGKRGQEGATHYGQVTLIGDRNLVDPQQDRTTDVYDTDMWSPTVPRPEYKLNQARRKAMREVVNSAFTKWSDYKTDSYEINYLLGAEDTTLDRLISSAAQKVPFKAEYISQVLGETPAIVRDENGQIDDAASRSALLDQFRRLVGYDSSEYNKWVEDQFRPLAGEALVKVGRKMMPYTAENVLEAMRKKGKLASQDTMFYGPGKVRAKGAKKLTSVKAMHSAEGQLASKQDFEKWKNEVGDPAFEDAHSKLSAEMTRAEKAKGYEPNPFDMLDEAARALASFISGKKSLESVTGISDLSEETKAAAQKYKDVIAQAKTEYFEAKPRRLVSLSEFRAAVVPASTPAELRQKLEEQGLKVYEYPDDDEAARQQITEQAAQAQNVFFQDAVPDKKWIETAPTGKPSNLAADQWRLVRTDEFKNWFGDWESASIIRQARNAWADEKSKNKYMFAPSEKLGVALKQLLGHDVKSIVITDDSIRHAKNHHSLTKEEAKRGQSAMTPEDIAILPYVVNNFDSIEREPKHDKKSGRALTISKRINGLSVVATLEQGKKNVFVVTTWKKNMTGAADAQSASRLYVQDGPVTPLEIIKRDVAKIKSSFDNASKVVDENGEPKIMYHLSGSKDIQSFQSGNSAGLIYFAESEKAAKQGARSAKYSYPVYLNVRAPVNTQETAIPWYEAENSKKVAQWKQEGKDGVYVKDESGVSLAVFAPEQIKSVDNRGSFDESANIYNQDRNGQQARGQIEIGPNGEGIITLFENADRSTFFHELGHLFLDNLITDALNGVSERSQKDLDTVRKYLGIEDLDLSKRHTFTGEELARYTQAQEMFARSWEAYLMEGIAPTPELRGIFAKLKRWLIDIYKDAIALDVALSDDVRSIFDHLLMTEDEIEAANTTVEQLAAVNDMTDSRISELEKEIAAIPRVISAQWDSAGLDDENAPDWVTRELMDGAGDALAKGRPALVKAIRKLGGIRYDSVVATWGEGEAKELRARDRSLFRKDGAAFDTLVAELEHEGLHVEDAQDLYNRLMADEPKITKGLNVAITEETLPWLFYLMDDSEVRDYAARRLRQLNKELRALQEADDHTELRTRGPEIAQEQSLIREVLATIKNPKKRKTAVSEASDAAFIGKDVDLSFGPVQGEAEHESIPTQEAADRAAGLLSDDELISLKEADRRAWRRAQRESRRAFFAGKQEGIAQARAKLAAMKEAQRKRKAEREEINKTVKFMKRALVSKSISWTMQQKIKELLEGYTLRRPNKKKLAEARAILDYIEQTPDAELSQYTPSQQRYVKMLETTTLNDMTLADVRELRQKVEEMYDEGRAQYDRWSQEREARRQRGFADLMSALGDGTAPDSEVKTIVGPADLEKQYKGVKGKLAKVKDWTLANTLGANRFFDWLGGGRGDYKSAFTHYFVDRINEALDDELRHSQARFEQMEQLMSSLGLSFEGMNELRNVDGQFYSVDQLIHIYAGLKNEASRKAITYGNMRLRLMRDGEAGVQEHIAHCVAALTDAERQLGDAVITDFNVHFERINNALIDAFNQGMKHEENYTPMARLEYSAQALNNILNIDENKMIEGEASMKGTRNASVEKGFLEERMEIDDEHQQPIKLGLLSLWHDQVHVQEHTAAYGKLAGDLRSMLMQRDEHGVTIGRRIVDVFGREALAYLREYTNIAIQGQNITASTVLDGVYSYLGRNMAIAYLTLNFGTVLKQITSLPRFLITAGPTFILKSTGEFLASQRMGKNLLLEEIYKLDPQMKNRTPDAFLQVLKDARQSGKVKSSYMKMLDKMMAPISIMDRTVSAIGWWATYQSGLKHGLSEAEAIREAQRAVALTQQTPLAKDMPRVWNQNGVMRLMMIFTSDMANTWGMSIYDLTHSESGRDRLMTVAALGMTALLMGMMQGGPDDDDEFIAWYMKQLMEQQVGATPVIGKEVMSAIDAMSNRFGRSNYSALSAPLVKIMQGVGGWFADDADKIYSDGTTKRERSFYTALEGLSLFVPFPFTTVNRIRRALNSDDGGEAARIMLGMRLGRRK